MRKKLPQLYGEILALELLSNKNKNRKQRKAMINTISSRQKNVIGGMMKDFLYDKNKRYCTHPDLTPAFFKKLKKDRIFIEKLCNKKTSDKEFKNILNKKGGILGAIIPLALSMLGPILAQ